MNLNYSVIPALLTDSMDEFKQKLQTLQELGVKRVSIDIIDGIYVDNLTVGVDDLWDVDFGDMDLDLHLMVEEPVDYLGQVSGLKARQKRVIGQVERMGSQQEFLSLGKSLEMEVGWGIDLHTPIESVAVEELIRADCVLLLSVPAGYSGQKFQPIVVKKIEELRKREFAQDIIMDGGMNPATMEVCLNAGANQFAVTSYLWQADKIKNRLEDLERILVVGERSSEAN